MWKILKIPPPMLSYTSKIFKEICNSIWIQIELVHNNLYEFIKLSFPFDNLKYIEKIAKDRGIIKLPNETNELFHLRIINSFTFLKFSSTLKGIENIIFNITKKKFKIRELYKESWVLGDNRNKLGFNTVIKQNRLNYYFIIDFNFKKNINSIRNNNKISLKEKKYIEDTIEIYKPAHINFHISAEIEK